MLCRIFLGSAQARGTSRLSRSGILLRLYRSQYVPFTALIAQCATARHHSTKESVDSTAEDSSRPHEQQDESEKVDVESASSGIPWGPLFFGGAIFLWLLYLEATDSQQLNLVIHAAFKEEMKQAAVDVDSGASNHSYNDCMTRKIACVRVARRVRPPDPADIQSVHNYLQSMVLIMNLMTLGPKLAEKIGREPLELFDFEPKTLRKLVKSTKDPTTSHLAAKAEKKLFNIQLQACWDIYNVLNPESTRSLRTGKMDEVYVEEVVEVIMDSIKTARSFTPVFKGVIERAREVEEIRRWVKKLKR